MRLRPAMDERYGLFALDLFPSVYTGMALFTQVTNASELRSLIMEGALSAALLRPQLVLDPFQLLASANKAVHGLMNESMKTKTVHTEIIFNLSPSNNISESFKKFGISDDSQEVLLAVIDDRNATSLRAACDQVKGKLVHLDSLTDLADVPLVKNLYKVPQDELAISSLLYAVVSRMATKEAMK
ncbi:EKC/KEOPS complex subunit Tprkb-like [Corticium candelabrum]|uniref:EKC/KEOPS complex subunit Tprkb-like n=1 Tax=Corticium candelabrum TaxID=121492 RepID=UPI002E270587|nr:EKC/KEOPS complex subunit Tprkb-like [Corticium candelabrum]